MGACAGGRAAWRHGGLTHAGLAALRDDARRLRRDRSELAGCHRAGAALRHLGDTAVRRARRIGNRGGPRAGALERTVALEWAPRARLRLHRRGWVTTRRLALHG